MAGKPRPPLMRFVGGGRHFRLGVRDASGEMLAHEVVAGNVDLDAVDAFPDHRAHRASHLVRAVGDDLDALVVQVQLALVAQASGGDDLGRRRLEAGSRDPSGVDGVAHDDLGAGLRRCRRIEAGEAAVQQQLGVLHRDQDVLFGRDLAELLQADEVVVRDMGVRLGQAGHQRAAGAVEDLAAVARDLVPAARDRLDAVAFDQHLAGIDVVACPVEDAHVREQLRLHGARSFPACAVFMKARLGAVGGGARAPRRSRNDGGRP